MGGLEGVDAATGQGIIEGVRAEVVGLELEGVAIGLHRLLELAGVEPVPLAMRAAVDQQVGPQKRRLRPGWSGTAGIARCDGSSRAVSEASKRSSSLGLRLKKKTSPRSSQTPLQVLQISTSTPPLVIVSTSDGWFNWDISSLRPPS